MSQARLASTRAVFSCVCDWSATISKPRRLAQGVDGSPPVLCRRDALYVRYGSDSVAKVFLSHRLQIFRAVGAAIEY
jgi:hypothetical protein